MVQLVFIRNEGAQGFQGELKKRFLLFPNQARYGFRPLMQIHDGPSVRTAKQQGQEFCEFPKSFRMVDQVLRHAQGTARSHGRQGGGCRIRAVSSKVIFQV